MNRRPSGANVIAVGFDNPVICVSVNPLGKVAARVAAVNDSNAMNNKAHRLSEPIKRHARARLHTHALHVARAPTNKANLMICSVKSRKFQREANIWGNCLFGGLRITSPIMRVAPTRRQEKLSAPSASQSEPPAV